VTSNEAWRKYLEAGTALGQQTVARAEEIARGLFAPEEGERREAWQEVDQLARFGMQVGEQLVDVARAELTRQLKNHAVGSFDDLLERVKDLIGSYPTAEADPTVATPLTVSADGDEKKNEHEDKAKADKAKVPGASSPLTSPKNVKKGDGDKNPNKKHKKKTKKEKELTGESRGGVPDRVLSLAKPMGSVPSP